MNKIFAFDTKKIIFSAITLALGVIFLISYINLLASLVLFIVSLIAIYLFLSKGDESSLVVFATIFLVSIAIKFSPHQLIALVSIGAFIFMVSFFVVYAKHTEINNLVYSSISVLLVVQILNIISLASIQTLGIAIIVAALYLAISQIINNSNDKWGLNSYIYCIMFILVAIPIVIFY